jgi:hypothetical protein
LGEVSDVRANLRWLRMAAVTLEAEEQQGEQMPWRFVTPF